LALSRITASPLRAPSPGSTISVARVPTTIPTFGTIGLSSSGMTNTCSESLMVWPSFTTGGICATP